MSKTFSISEISATSDGNITLRDGDVLTLGKESLNLITALRRIAGLENTLVTANNGTIVSATSDKPNGATAIANSVNGIPGMQQYMQNVRINSSPTSLQ